MTFPFSFLGQAHEAMAWQGFQSALSFGFLLPSNDRLACCREIVNLSSTSLFSMTGAKGLTATAGCWMAAARAGNTMRKRGVCDCAEMDITGQRRGGADDGGAAVGEEDDARADVDDESEDGAAEDNAGAEVGEGNGTVAAVADAEDDSEDGAAPKSLYQKNRAKMVPIAATNKYHIITHVTDL